METNKTTITSKLSGILAPNAMSTIELLNVYAKYIEEHAIQGEAGKDGKDAPTIVSINWEKITDTTYNLVATLSNGDVIKTSTPITTLQGIQGEKGEAGTNGTNGKDALIAGYVFTTSSRPDTLSAPKSAFQFSREPEVDDSFIVIETNTTNGDCYVCIADVISIENDTVTASIETYAIVSTNIDINTEYVSINMNTITSNELRNKISSLKSFKELSGYIEFANNVRYYVSIYSPSINYGTRLTDTVGGGQFYSFSQSNVVGKNDTIYIASSSSITDQNKAIVYRDGTKLYDTPSSIYLTLIGIV